MDEILKKIDELIDKTNYELYKAGLEDAKDIILSQHKQLATDNNVVTKSGKDNNVLTIGDKIRESNESLVEWYANRVNLYVCGESVTVNPLNKEKCLNYLNQPYTDTTN